ncbi:ABC transporter substrate-binding protein [Paenibacillus mucilaginosus]|uniref:Iron ABC transporter iron-binding subunit n=1 Tax=Paenibacillus mucilaginosus (strain KNP414) TaxID=1036673 RepID=F8FJZ7_PAEMK|nr:ABC transporter substrate-binding protein [Paenibacillus mucilaginosus]AEI44038.1 iron ABC transporter iron-binding subunit [Paenibacillus mucilaginosus KNP414]MCG7212474.1 ABC transporter substrate-binding protein [Paenibacillus mucilaginosus]WDM25490.1 ABC transporter substrate-binding protein [Paenibacillus mucilaginosus]
MQKKRKTIGLIGLLTVLALTGCGTKAQPGASAPAAGAGTQESAAASGTLSGTLNFYTSQPEEDVTKLVAAFQGKYPDVRVAPFRSGTEEVIAKVQAEKQAGKVQADLLLLADSVTFESLKRQDLLAAYQSPEAAKLPPGYADGDGAYTGTKIIATVLAVHTGKVKTVPASWKALTAPENKNAAVMPSPLYSGAAAYNIGVFTRTEGFGWDYLRSLKEGGMTVVKGNGAVLKSVASGEKSMAMVVDYLVAREKAKGSPVDLVYPSEGVPVITEPIAIVKNSPNRKLAEAFVDFVLSEEGQTLASKLGYTPLREGVPAPQGLKALKDIKVLSASPAELVEAREADKKQFTEVFGQ